MEMALMLHLAAPTYFEASCHPNAASAALVLCVNYSALPRTPPLYCPYVFRPQKPKAKATLVRLVAVLDSTV